MYEISMYLRLQLNIVQKEYTLFFGVFMFYVIRENTLFDLMGNDLSFVVSGVKN